MDFNQPGQIPNGFPPEKDQERDALDDVVNEVCMHGTVFKLTSHYRITEPVGQGAYGVVCAAEDIRSGICYAVKKIECAFEHRTFTKRTLRELRVLRHLRHENLLEIFDVRLPYNSDTFEDIYVVSELMETDLASILKSSQPLSESHTQFFLYQLLRGMKFVHSADVIHRDLKPRNLLVNSNCDLKICDFGLARLRDLGLQDLEQPDRGFPLTEYVCTRWYRAPEVLCNQFYGLEIDVWSIGCIFAELLNRKPLLPGKDTLHQCELVIGLLGRPGTNFTDKVENPKCVEFLMQQEVPQRSCKSIKELFLDNYQPQDGEGDEESRAHACDLLATMLTWEPNIRATCASALEHPYLASLHDPEDEPSFDGGQGDTILSKYPDEFEFEKYRISASMMRKEIFREMLRYYPERLRDFPDCINTRQYHSFNLLRPGDDMSDQMSEDQDGGNNINA